ncbi:MAG: PAS domain S-box protein [Methanoregula sp.]
MYHILYVDDEPGLLEICRIFLERSGQFSVDTITSAHKALSLLDTKSYDAIISDYQMPGMNGIQFLREVRTHFGKTPFVLFTGKGREEVVIQAIDNGVDAYIQKGGDPRAQFAELSHKIIQTIERVRAEQALADSEGRYRMIVETTDEGIAQMDEKFDMVYVNHRLAEMHGCTAEEMIGHNITSFMAAEDIPGNSSLLKKCRLGKSGRYERRYTTKDGKIRWMQVSATPLMSPDGTFRGSFAMYSDITDHKTAEIEIARRNDELAKRQSLLEESEQRYRNVVEDQSEFICRFLPDGTHVFVNEAYCEYFDLKREDIIGHRFQPKIPTEDQDRIKQLFKSLTPAHPVATIEHRIIMPDGVLRWQRWSDRAIFDLSGTVTEYQSVGRDVTRGREAEAALEKSEARFREQYQNNPLALFTWQCREDDFILVDCNRAAEILSCGRSHNYVGKTASELYANRPEILALVWHCFSEKTVISTDLVSDHFLPGRRIHATAAFVPPDLVMVHMDDISEQKEAEEALRESQRKLAEAMDLANLATWECDIRTGILTFDDRFSTLYGTDEKIKCINHMTAEAYIRDLVHPEDRHILAEEDEKTRSTADPHYVSKREYRIVRRDGRIRHIEMCVGVIKDAEGRTIKTHGVNQDITERKEAEEALRGAYEQITAQEEELREQYDSMVGLQQRTAESQQLLRQVLNTVPVRVFWKGKNLVYQGCNEPFARDSGLSNPMDLIGKTDFEMAWKAQADLYRADDQRVIDTGIPKIGYMEPQTTVEGNRFWLRSSKVPLRDADGTIVGILGSYEDITEHKEAEEALRESEEKFRSFVENADDVVFSLTPGGVISYVSPKWTKLLGYDTSEIIGKTAAGFIHPDDYPRNREFFHQTFVTGKQTSGLEYRIRNKNGSWQWHSQNGSLMRDAEGEIIAYLGISRDITEQKKAADALRRVNRQLSLLTGITRHDILNKVSVLRGYLTLVQMQFKDPALAQYLKKMESATTTIQSQIEFTRIYQDLGTLEPQWIALDTVMPYSQLPASIILNADVKEVAIFADSMLEKVFSNLLDNSIRHGERVTEIRVSSQKSGTNLVVIWEDNGRGISSDEKERIFDRGHGKNTGLGLFLVREILSLTNITITETGVAGKGARFEMIIPVSGYRFIPPVKTN